MTFGMECPWCAAEVEADLADPAVGSVTCPACSTSVDLEAVETIALPLAA